MNDEMLAVWPRLLPAEMRGGTNSKSRQEALRKKKMERSSFCMGGAKRGKAAGGMVVSLLDDDFTPASKMSAQENHTAEATGNEIGRFTGTSNKNFVKPLEAVDEEVHEGEYVVSAPLLNIIGGVEALEDGLLRMAGHRVKSASTNMNIDKKGRKAVLPISEDIEANNIQEAKFERATGEGRADGGLEEDNKTNSFPSPFGEQKAPEITQHDTNVNAPTTLSPTGEKTTPPVATQNTTTGTSTNNLLLPIDELTAPAKQSVPMPTFETTEPVKAEKAVEMPTLQPAITPPPMPTFEAPEPIKAVQAAPSPLLTPAPIQAAPQPVTQPTTTQPVSTAPIQAQPTQQSPISAATSLQQQSLMRLAAMASGDNPLLKRTIEEALQKNAGDTVAARKALEAQLAAQGVTGTAAAGILNAFDSNASANRAGLEGDLAKKIMETAVNSNKDLLNASTALKAQEDADKKAKGENINRLNEDVRKSLTANPNADWTKDSTLNSRLDELYRETGATGDITAWKNETMKRIKQENDPYFQARNEFTTEKINSFFGSPEDLASFEFNGKTGEEGFRDAYADWKSKGGVKWNAQTNTFDVDFEHPAFKAMYVKPEKVAVPTESLVAGGTFSNNDRNYTISGISEDGSLQLSFGDNGTAIGKKNADGSVTITVTKPADSENVNEFGYSESIGTLKYEGKDVAYKFAGKSMPVERTADGVFITIDGKKVPAEVDYAGGVVPVAPFVSGGKVYGTDGALLKGDGSELSFDNAALKNISDGKTAIATSKEGKLYTVTAEGNVKPYTEKDFAKAVIDMDAATIKSTIAKMKDADKNIDDIASAYLDQIGKAGKPDATVLTELISAGSTKAKESALEAMKEGRLLYSGNAEMEKLVKDNSSDFSAPSTRIVSGYFLGNVSKIIAPVSKRVAKVGEIIKLPDGSYGVVTRNNYDEYKDEGDNRRLYTYTVRRMDNGKEESKQYAVMA